MIQALASNCHTHSQFCDGKNTAEEMVLSALENGFESLGFSSHSPQKFSAHYSMHAARMKEYPAEIERLQKKYASMLRIVCGIERELFSDWATDGYAYTIGSVHYLPSLDGLFPVDGSAEKLFDGIRNGYRGNVFSAIETYYRLVVTNVLAIKPTVIGHFDLIRKNNRAHPFFDETDPQYLDTALEALHCVYSPDILLEVNTGGIARGYADTPYPAFPLLKEWASLGGKITVTSDCHSAAQIACYYDHLPNLLQKAGFTHVYRLSAGTDKLFEPFTL